MRRPLAALALALAAVTAAAPGRAATPERVEAARVAVNLFMETCYAHMAEPDKVAALVGPGQRLEMAELPPEMSYPFLAGRGGRAFSASGFALALLDGGACLVYAQKADAAELNRYFRKVMDAANRDTFTMVETHAQERDGRSAHAWDLVPAGAHLKALRAKLGKGDYPALFEAGLTTAPPGGLFEGMLSTVNKVKAITGKD
ncbi:MAG: NMCC_0638 family (lipo)protein [Solirubrobacterales bacterium]